MYGNDSLRENGESDILQVGVICPCETIESRAGVKQTFYRARIIFSTIYSNL